MVTFSIYLKRHVFVMTRAVCRGLFTLLLVSFVRYVFVIVTPPSHLLYYFAYIMKACLHNFYLLKPHFYTVKLVLAGVYIISPISAQKHRLRVLVRTASPRRFYQVPQSMFWTEIWKIFEFFFLKKKKKKKKKIIFLVVTFSIYLKRHVFVMTRAVCRGLFTLLLMLFVGYVLW